MRQWYVYGDGQCCFAQTEGNKTVLWRTNFVSSCFVNSWPGVSPERMDMAVKESFPTAQRLTSLEMMPVLFSEEGLTKDGKSTDAGPRMWLLHEKEEFSSTIWRDIVARARKIPLRDVPVGTRLMGRVDCLVYLVYGENAIGKQGPYNLPVLSLE